MISEFIIKMMRVARYKLLENGDYFGVIPPLKGVWANAKNLEKCRAELQEVLEDWLVLKMRDRETIPGFSVKTRKRVPLTHV